MRAHLEPDGDGWRLEAYKNYVTGGHRAVACLVWCRFPGSEPGTGKGIGAVLVDLSADGVSVAGTHKKMGLRGCTEAELAFDGVRVAPEDVLVTGDPADNSGLKTLLAHINHERCGNAAMCLGAAQGALEYAIGYMRERTVGTRKLADLQGLQWKIADMAVELEGARLLLDRALALAGPGGTPPPLESAMAKIACNLAAKKVCDEAIQLLGGYGYSREYPVERAYRDIRGLCHRGGHGGDPAQLRGHLPAVGQGAGRSLVEGTPAVTAAGSDMATVATPVGLLGVGAAAPSLRLSAADVGAAWGSGGGRGTVALCDADEDTLTLAWQAALAALGAAGVGAPDLSGLWWGTTRPPFAEGPSHAFLSTALGLDPAAGGILCSGSPHAGMEALLAAWDALAAGHARLALVVASDALVPGVGTAAEATTGAGAVAFVLGAIDPTSSGGNGSGAAARLVARATRVMAVVDRYRGDAEAATGDIYDGRLFREEVFVPLLAAAGGALGAGERPDRPLPTGWAIADPDGKLASAVAKRLGAPLVSAPVQAALGDTGAAAALLGAVHGFAGPEAPAVLGVIAYGGGRATAVTAQLSRPVPGADEAVAALAGGRRVPYVHALRARGQLEPMSDPIPMGVPPAGAAFVRGNVEMLAFEGARCRACGTISTPPSIHPRCTGCGGADLDVVATGPHRPGPDLRGQPDHAASLPGAAAHGGHRPRRRGPDHGPGFLGRRRRPGHRRRGDAVAAALRHRTRHPRLRL